MKNRLPENIWNSPVIRKRLAQEASFESNHGKADKPYYWMLAPQGDSLRGEVTLKNYVHVEGLDLDPHPIQMQFARDIRAQVQKEASFGGVWVVGWTHPPALSSLVRVDGDNVWWRLVMIWLDEDADPQFTVESDIPVIEMLENGVQNYIDQANRAYDAWNEAYGKRAMKDDFGLSEAQTTKAALSALH